MKIAIADLEIDMCEFPIATSLSLEPVVNRYWKQKASQGHALERPLAQSVLAQWEATPQLHGVIDDYSLLDEHADLVALLLDPLLPYSFSHSSVAAAVVPYGKYAVHSTPLFRETAGKEMEKAEALIDKKPYEQMVYRKLLHAYLMIFKEFYAIDLPVDKTLLIEAPEPGTGFERYIKADIRPDFIDVVLRSEPKELDEASLRDIVENAHDLRVWMKHLPFHHFEFRGVALFNAIDVTAPEILSRLKYDLLDKDALTNPDKFAQLQRRLQSLFRLPDLRLGITGYNAHSRKFDTSGTLQGMSVAYGINECPRAQVLHEQIVNRDEPFIISHLDRLAEQEGGMWDYMLREGKVSSLMLAPLRDESQFIGLLELASATPGALSASLLLLLRDIVPMFSVALRRNMEERESQVEAVIKRQYTAIHPAVEWRFIEAANRYLAQKSQGETPEAEEIVFKGVYPLYGASDVRSSSTLRNEAIQGDLIEHLQLAKEAVGELSQHLPLPVLEQLQFKIDQHIVHIEGGLFSGDEMEVISFLRSEVEPCLQSLSKQVAGPASSIYEAYRQHIDPQLGVVYRRRKDFEDSLTTLNDAIADFLENAEEEAQALFPHYFEKYKTDGVEYNIYIGQSLSPQRPFNDFYLKNLRLWQLTTTAQIAQLAQRLKPSLPMPLEATHLLLVHSGQLSVQFRLDERQFDVEGAYNIRYEIVKKRIDKAHIKGTQERLTQPRHIAVVYSQEKDAREYREYMEFLRHKGLLEGEVEDVELEALQGVQGLRALRVKVAPPAAQALQDQDLPLALAQTA